MSFLARKIALAKWERTDGLGPCEIPGDAVGDLRTSGNTLSFWRCAQTTDEALGKAALALAANLERLDRLDLAWVAEAEIAPAGLSHEDSDGQTPVVSLRKLHVDITRLDLSRLGKVTTLVANAIASKQYKRLTKKEVLAVLVAAVRTELVLLTDLHEAVQGEVSKGLGQPG